MPRRSPSVCARIERVFRARLSRLPVANHPALFFNPFVEGYRNYCFGGKVGPRVETEAVFHELAHAAEFGPDAFAHRGVDGRFAFKVPQVFVYNRYCDEAKTAQATLRELRTFANQWYLMTLAGKKISKTLFAQRATYSMKFMHDQWNVPGTSSEEKHQWCTAKVLELIEHLTAEDVVARLERWLDATASHLQAKQSMPAQEPTNYSRDSDVARYSLTAEPLHS